MKIQIPEGLQELAPSYLAARKDELRKLAEFIDASDFDSIRSIAHNLKGTGTSYGFEVLTDLGAVLESSAKQHDWTAVKQQASELVGVLVRSRAMRQLMERM